jgi:mRNA interferase RelE/StbE
MYKLRYKKSVLKDLKKLPKTIRVAIVKKIQSLTDNPQPNGSVKLRGASNIYRIRHTDYRIIYSIESGELVIFIIKVAHRKEVYRDF